MCVVQRLYLPKGFATLCVDKSRMGFGKIDVWRNKLGWEHLSYAWMSTQYRGTTHIPERAIRVINYVYFIDLLNKGHLFKINSSMVSGSKRFHCKDQLLAPIYEPLRWRATQVLISSYSCIAMADKLVGWWSAIQSFTAVSSILFIVSCFCWQLFQGECVVICKEEVWISDGI